MMSNNIIRKYRYNESKFPNALKVMENGKLVKKMNFKYLEARVIYSVIDDKQEIYRPDKSIQ